MPNPRLSFRYAKSLIDLAVEKEQLEKVFADMQWLQQVIKISRDFLNLLRSPIVKADKKAKIVDAVIKGKVSDMTTAFIRLLIRKGRESHLPEIITSFVNQYKLNKGIHTVKLTTATPVSDKIKKSIVDQVKKSGEFENIQLETAVKEDLIGGFVLQVGDQLVDASIAYDLKEVAKQFENNDFIYKIR